MKCEDCCHAEMCKWIDELESRGCDFYDGKPCELLILKSDIFLHQDDRKKWAESIEQEKAKGLIILPPYFTPVLVPDDVEIQIEQEPCDDAISREALVDDFIEWREKLEYTVGEDYSGVHLLNVAIQKIWDMPSVTQKSETVTEFADRCRECGARYGKLLKQKSWIPVSESLPEDEQEILFSTKTGRVHSGKYHDDDSANQWYSHRDKCRAWNNVVIAWMPLPKPYEPQERSE